MAIRGGVVAFVASGFLVALGCSRSGSHGGPTPPATETPSPTATPENRIDQVLMPRFAAEAITPEAASDEELCRRLSADLLGRYVTLDEVKAECTGRTVDQIAADFQTRDEYLVNAERFWRDRFLTSDIFAGWRDLKDLYSLVDAMHRDELPYDQFAIQAMSHPAMMTLVPFPEDRADRVFNAFMGRPPTRTEKLGLAALYRPWAKKQGTDPDIRLITRTYATVDPSMCAPTSTCSTSLYGVTTTLDFSSYASLPAGPTRWYQLNDTQKDALRAPGRLLTAQPFFWEAAADEILHRLLGWSDGGRRPNEPGILLPEVRDVLAEYLRETKSIPKGERLVMGSWLYRMTSRVPDDAFGDDPNAPVKPLWASGPRNPIIAEVWMRSAQTLSSAKNGDCDPRYTDHFLDKEISGPGADNEAARLKLWTVEEDRTPWDPILKAPDLRFRDAARTIGGCPGFMPPMLTALPRRPQTGLAHAFAQETLAESYCAQPASPAEPGITVAIALEREMSVLYGRRPTNKEIAEYETAFASCSGDECTPEGIVNGVCVALLGGAEMVFH